MAAHSSILVWEIPRPEEPGGLQSMGLQRVGHDLVTEQKQQPLAHPWAPLPLSPSPESGVLGETMGGALT